jgi:hypothetical protein
MPREFLMLEMVPYLLVWIPVRRVLGKMKYMQSFFAFNLRFRLLRCMRWCLIHDDDKVAI